MWVTSAGMPSMGSWLKQALPEKLSAGHMLYTSRAASVAQTTSAFAGATSSACLSRASFRARGIPYSCTLQLSSSMRGRYQSVKWDTPALTPEEHRSRNQVILFHHAQHKPPKPLAAPNVFMGM